MKRNIFNLLFVCFAILFCGALSSCEKEDEGEYFAGESADDFVSATYSLEAKWDLSNAPAYKTNASSKETELNKTYSKSQNFDSRKTAESYFDQYVLTLASKKDSDLKGAKCVLKLKRGQAIMKQSTLTW